MPQGIIGEDSYFDDCYKEDSCRPLKIWSLKWILSGKYGWRGVRGQLLTVEFNFYYFSNEGGDNDFDFDYSKWEWDGEDIYHWIEEAYDFLETYQGYNWRTNSMGYTWSEYRAEGNDIKEAMKEFNTMGDDVFE